MTAGINKDGDVMKNYCYYLSSLFLSNIALAGMSDADKIKLTTVVDYMANYFLQVVKHLSTVWRKIYGICKSAKNILEIGINEKWDDGVNKGVDKHYGSKYDEAKTNDCHSFVNKIMQMVKKKLK